MSFVFNNVLQKLLHMDTFLFFESPLLEQMELLKPGFYLSKKQDFIHEVVYDCDHLYITTYDFSFFPNDRLPQSEYLLVDFLLNGEHNVFYDKEAILFYKYWATHYVFINRTTNILYWIEEEEYKLEANQCKCDESFFPFFYEISLLKNNSLLINRFLDTSDNFKTLDICEPMEPKMFCEMEFKYKETWCPYPLIYPRKITNLSSKTTHILLKREKSSFSNTTTMYRRYRIF